MPQAGSQIVFAGLGRDRIDDRLDQRARREVLAGAALGVLRVLLQQALVGVALHVGVDRQPVLLVDQVDDQPPQLGRVLDLVLRLAEDQAEHALLLAQFLERVAVVVEQLVAVLRSAGSASRTPREPGCGWLYGGRARSSAIFRNSRYVSCST